MLVLNRFRPMTGNEMTKPKWQNDNMHLRIIRLFRVWIWSWSAVNSRPALKLKSSPVQLVNSALNIVLEQSSSGPVGERCREQGELCVVPVLLELSLVLSRQQTVTFCSAGLSRAALPPDPRINRLSLPAGQQGFPSAAPPALWFTSSYSRARFKSLKV